MAPTSVGLRAVVAVNAHASGLRDPETVLAAILAASDGAGVDVGGTVTESEDDLRDALERADGGRLVLVGGAGSVHFAVIAAARPLEIGLVPMGRAHDVAASA